jgi:hypothetical protein
VLRRVVTAAFLSLFELKAESLGSTIDSSFTSNLWSIDDIIDGIFSKFFWFFKLFFEENDCY